MYGQLFWLDHAVTPASTYNVRNNADGTITLTPAGTIIQQGTNLSAVNFNRMEEGIQDANIAAAILAFAAKHNQRHAQEHEAAVDSEILGETHNLTLTNTQKYPFNSTMDAPVSVALTTPRNNLYYTVEATVADGTVNAGNIHITGKALNGFKIAFDGSAKSVALTIRVKGGMA